MAKRLEPLLPKLALRLAPENRGQGFEIRRDGVVLKPGAWDADIPVDPGEHVIEASAPGKKTWRSTVRIDRAATTTTVAIPVLEADASASSAPGGGSFWGAQRVAGAAVAGAGAAGLVVGSILGGLALSKASSLKSGGHCNADLTVCDAVGVPQWQDGQMLAHGSTAAFVVGGVALAAGVVVFATAPHAKGSDEPKSGFRVVLGPVAHGGSLRLSGGW